MFSYSSTISVRGKTAIWDNFKSGQFRVICAMDAAGMGCNVPDIHHTVVFGVPKFPKSISAVVQCWGWTVRNCNIPGTCQFLVPSWAFRPSTANVVQKAEPKRSVKQRDGIQPAIEKFINIWAEDPRQGRLFGHVQNFT